jgi:hypothetical protein
MIDDPFKVQSLHILGNDGSASRRDDFHFSERPDPGIVLLRYRCELSVSGSLSSMWQSGLQNEKSQRLCAASSKEMLQLRLSLSLTGCFWP